MSPSVIFRRVLVGVGLLGLLALGLQLATARREARREALRLSDRLRGLQQLPLSDASGRPVTFAGSPRVVFLLISVTCPHCHEVLGRLKDTRGDLARLVVIVTQGRAPGQRLLDSLGISATAYGILGDGRASLDALGIRAVPVLMEVDSAGVVVAAVGGEISAAEARAWVQRIGGSSPVARAP